MTTLTGARTRTITGYVVTLLEYPRLLIEREVDFTHCHLHGTFDAEDDTCRHCEFGEACRWLNGNRNEPSPDTPLPDLIHALQTAVEYLRSDRHNSSSHARNCDCDSCLWIREATAFLRIQRHKTANTTGER